MRYRVRYPQRVSARIPPMTRVFPTTRMTSMRAACRLPLFKATRLPPRYSLVPNQNATARSICIEQPGSPKHSQTEPTSSRASNSSFRVSLTGVNGTEEIAHRDPASIRGENLQAKGPALTKALSGHFSKGEDLINFIMASVLLPIGCCSGSLASSVRLKRESVLSSLTLP